MLARVLAGEPRLLLADEPGSGLDPAHQLQVMDHLRRLARQGRGVVVVLHDLTLAARFCDRLVFMHNGAVAADGPSAEVLTEGHVEAVFGVRCIATAHGGKPLLVPWETL
jgi:iron complex transport system ATP-binding protein